MKFQVKTTALAILVSSGVVGCKSNDTPNQVVEPTPANQASKTDAEKKAEADAKAKATAEAKAKAEAEAKAKAEEAKRLEEERKKAEAEAKKLTDAKAKAEAEAKAKAAAEAKAKAEAAEKLKPVNLLDKNGVAWRIINIRQNGPSNDTTEYRYGGRNSSLSSDLYYVGKPESFFELLGVNAITNLNFNELSEKDGKPFLGVHQGKKEDPDFSGKIVTKVKRDGHLIKVAELEDAKAFNYLYVNQPYSTYGALFTNGHDVKFFSVAQSAGKAGYSHIYPVWREEVVERNGQSVKTGKIIWNDAVAGEATYKGQVIASVIKSDIEGYNRTGIRSEPVLDGTVTLKAKFDKDPERNSIEGEIDSNLIGKIVLEKNLDQSGTFRLGRATNETMNIKEASGRGTYEVKFYGKDLNDAVGKVNLNSDDAYTRYKETGDVIQYDAVFGATKQPK
ncbi:hypothetical protein AM305_11335 [Actinobacillus minor NM305]|uniref:Uncharacterized protein n=1 Tax=Actinobacillus minor NM305 TaxID=637911 RepID=C5S313_9PAST|nr:hypothetical protein [Actinobacillus minor]EER46768.1 hypothetical protein AM305_11335 [Actinobacillus minor NM305]